ncbi:hypothetical protein AB0M94_40175 [Streptomyces xanthochromogenes]|uniref:hypothetical protein n=1 Tax=Streptomyces xanthochromogenes TaxID=67384 RepID=UPI0034281A0A
MQPHLPRLEPVERRGCAVCRAWGERRAVARERGDQTALDAANIEIAAHPHQGPGLKG